MADNCFPAMNVKRCQLSRMLAENARLRSRLARALRAIRGPATECDLGDYLAGLSAAEAAEISEMYDRRSELRARRKKGSTT